MAIASPPKRAGPLAIRKMDGGTADVARSNIEAPKSRALILSEHSSTAHGQMAATRRLTHNRNKPRLNIHCKQMTHGYADDGPSRRGRDCVNHRLSRNALAEIFENRFLEAPLLNPVLREMQVWHGHGAATLRSVHESDHAGRPATNGFR